MSDDPRKLKQRNVRVAPHDFRSYGRRSKVRYTGMYADNPMSDPARPLDEADEGLIERLEKIVSPVLAKADIIGGARLTENGFRKVADALGVSPAEVESLFAIMRERMKEEDAKLSEAQRFFEEARFVFEPDFLGNVTIRDTKSGRTAHLRGKDAGAFMKRLEAGEREQDVIADYEHLMENDADHQKALDDTGFWGRAGAGCILLARDTGRFLVAHRSRAVEQPGTWGTWGGAIDAAEDPAQAAIREVREETGYRGKITAFAPLFVFKKDDFKYSNYLVIVPEEFEPRLNWESQGYRWVEFGEWPSPLHFGLKALLDDPKSHQLMQAYSYKKLEEDSEVSSERATPSGSYNFPWKAGGKKGFGVARFENGKDGFKVTVKRLFDEDHDPVTVPPALMKQIEQQAFDFIGDE